MSLLMWNKKYEKAIWNGCTLNILSTSINGGQRLHISEIPYSDLTYIKNMGASVVTVEIEVILVGASSLIDANTLIDRLNQTPRGELEHPWLGELKLCFQTYSQTITTKRGVVMLALKFVREGITAQLESTTLRSSNEQALMVEGISSMSFQDDVQDMTLDEIRKTMNDISSILYILQGVSNRLSISSNELLNINLAINHTFSAISGISHEPLYVAESLSKAIASLSNAMKIAPDHQIDAINNARNAQASLLHAIKKNVTQHLKVQLVIGALKMNKDMAYLESSSEFDITASRSSQSLILRDLNALLVAIDARIDEVTTYSTVDSFALYDALASLRNSVSAQYNKVQAGILPDQYKNIHRYHPSLILAHDARSKDEVLRALNTTHHPLFFRGKIALKAVK